MERWSIMTLSRSFDEIHCYRRKNQHLQLLPVKTNDMIILFVHKKYIRINETELGEQDQQGLMSI